MTALDIGSVENHRAREKGKLVYPVYSRRSGGVSLGINLFPQRKICSFDCPYCEVFPFEPGAEFSLRGMEEELKETLARMKAERTVVKDISFSGNGEPALSPAFPEALEKAALIRDSLFPGAALVLITNGTGLLREDIFEFLRGSAAGKRVLSIWLKLDAGTGAWYKEMSRSSVPFEDLVQKIRDFVEKAPVILQTMVCGINGRQPPPPEEAAWEDLVLELAAAAAGGNGRDQPQGIRAVQIYGKARPAPEDPLAFPLPVSLLEARAASLRARLERRGFKTAVEVYP